RFGRPPPGSPFHHQSFLAPQCKPGRSDSCSEPRANDDSIVVVCHERSFSVNLSGEATNLTGQHSTPFLETPFRAAVIRNSPILERRFCDDQRPGSGDASARAHDERILMSISLTSHRLCGRLNGIPLVQTDHATIVNCIQPRGKVGSLCPFQSHGESGGHPLKKGVIMIAGFLCSIIILGISNYGLAQQHSPQALKLTDAVDLALANYPAIRESRARAAAAREGINLARTLYIPRTDMLWQENRATRNNILGLMFPQGVIPSISGPVITDQSAQGAWGSAGGVLLSWEPVDFGLRKAQVGL